MVKVPTLISYLAVGFRYCMYCFLAAIGIPFLFRQYVLELFQLLQCFSIIARGLDKGAIRERSKMCYSQVYPYLTLDCWQEFWLFYLTREDHIPLSRLMLNRGGLDGSFDFSMQLHLDRADFRKADTAIMCQGKTPCLGIGKGIVAVASLKPGIAWLLTILNASEKCIKGSLKTQEHIL